MESMRDQPDLASSQIPPAPDNSPVQRTPNHGVTPVEINLIDGNTIIWDPEKDIKSTFHPYSAAILHVLRGQEPGQYQTFEELSALLGQDKSHSGLFILAISEFQLVSHVLNITIVEQSRYPRNERYRLNPTIKFVDVSTATETGDEPVPVESEQAVVKVGGTAPEETTKEPTIEKANPHAAPDYAALVKDLGVLKTRCLSHPAYKQLQLRVKPAGRSAEAYQRFENTLLDYVAHGLEVLACSGAPTAQDVRIDTAITQMAASADIMINAHFNNAANYARNFLQYHFFAPDALDVIVRQALVEAIVKKSQGQASSMRNNYIRTIHTCIADLVANMALSGQAPGFLVKDMGRIIDTTPPTQLSQSDEAYAGRIAMQLNLPSNYVAILRRASSRIRKQLHAPTAETDPTPDTLATRVRNTVGGLASDYRSRFG